LCEDAQTGSRTSGSVGHVRLEDHQKRVIKEEPDDEGYLCEGASSFPGRSSPDDGGERIKEEESEEEEVTCPDTAC
ncbi:zinc finger protein 32-like, partial [Clarias magur]